MIILAASPVAQAINANPMLAIGGLVLFGVVALAVAVSHSNMLKRHQRQD
jgi:hypothetical protein